jgi:uncharacterized membrane protein YgcG
MPENRVTREQFRAIVRQILAQDVTPWEILSEAAAEYAAHLAAEARAEEGDVDGNALEPGGGSFGGGGASGGW